MHHNPTDTKTLGIHFEGFETSLGKPPKKLVANAGYGSLENYKLLKNKKIKAYVKYNYFNKDQKSKQITTSPNNPELAKVREQVFREIIHSKRD